MEAEYRSDRERLVVVNEAGSILGYYNVGTCPFSGLHTAVEAEATKTH